MHQALFGCQTTNLYMQILYTEIQIFNLQNKSMGANLRDELRLLKIWPKHFILANVAALALVHLKVGEDRPG